MTPEADRRAWQDVLARAARLGGALAEGRVDAIARDERALFAGAVIRLKARFPVRFRTADAAAQAFLMLAKAFVEAGGSPLIARSLAALARDLAEILAADTRAAFERSCRAAGD